METTRKDDLFFRFQRQVLDWVARWSARSSVFKRRKAARFLVKLVFNFVPIRKSYVISVLRDNLGLSCASAAALAGKVYFSFFLNSIEMASIPYLTKSEIVDRLEVKGLEHLRLALSRGCGVIVVSGHYGLWEFIPPWLQIHGFPIAVVVRRQNNPHVDGWMHFMRTKHGVGITDSGFGLREILRTLKKGDCLGLMSDQDAGTKGIFVPFFGKLASTVVGPAEISQKLGSPIVVVGGHPRKTPPHLFEISAPMFPEDYPSGKAGAEAITSAFTQKLEEWIRRRPEQWFWLHRRWKTRPNDEA